MQSLCTLRNPCCQWPRNTRYQAGATPYLDRTSTGWIAPACGWRTYSITSSARANNDGGMASCSNLEVRADVGANLAPRRHRRLAAHKGRGRPGPDLIRSKTPSLSSRLMCASPPREPSIHLNEPPPMHCNSSNLTNARKLLRSRRIRLRLRGICSSLARWTNQYHPRFMLAPSISS
jgi:hypothetical protein